MVGLYVPAGPGVIEITPTETLHTQAIVHYEKRGEEIGRAPVCLMQHPTEDKPEPLVLRLTPYGLQMDERGAPHIAIGGAAVSQPARWG